MITIKYCRQITPSYISDDGTYVRQYQEVNLPDSKFLRAIKHSDRDVPYYTANYSESNLTWYFIMYQDCISIYNPNWVLIEDLY